MRSLLALVVAGTALMAAAPPAPSPPSPPREEWNGRRLVVRGKLAAVYVEPALYRRPDVLRGFFVAIWVRNLSDQPLGVADPGGRRFVHPNQWSVSDATSRTVVDERSLVPERLDEARRAELLRRMKAGALTVLPPGGGLESHVLFDGSGPADIARATGSRFLLSLDGQILVTDGRACESLEAKAEGTTAADLVLPFPIAWKELPRPSAK